MRPQPHSQEMGDRHRTRGTEAWQDKEQQVRRPSDRLPQVACRIGHGHGVSADGGDTVGGRGASHSTGHMLTCPTCAAGATCGEDSMDAGSVPFLGSLEENTSTLQMNCGSAGRWLSGAHKGGHTLAMGAAAETHHMPRAAQVTWTRSRMPWRGPEWRLRDRGHGDREGGCGAREYGQGAHASLAQGNGPSVIAGSLPPHRVTQARRRHQCCNAWKVHREHKHGLGTMARGNRCDLMMVRGEPGIPHRLGEGIEQTPEPPTTQSQVLTTDPPDIGRRYRCSH